MPTRTLLLLRLATPVLLFALVAVAIHLASGSAEGEGVAARRTPARKTPDAGVATPTPGAATATPATQTPGTGRTTPVPDIQDVRGGCAFRQVPTTYEGPQDRSLYIDATDLAAFNMLLPDDTHFGLPPLERGLRGSRTYSATATVPPVLLKAIAWIESAYTQASQQVPFEAIGPALVSFDCGYGIMQVTSGMTIPLGERGYPSPQQTLVATHFAYDIARGTLILADKWNAAPEHRPIAGTDTGGDPSIIENWYFAVWSYNGFTGPGANRSNHPMDPIYGAWPRLPYSCGPSTDGLGHNRGTYPFQELVLGCASHPPQVNGVNLWTPQPVDLPNLNDARWREPLRLENFVYPYDRMDIPTPRESAASPQTPATSPTATAQPPPASSGAVGHRDPTQRPPASLRDAMLGAPNLSVSTPSVSINYSPETAAGSASITIRNTGTGILSWMAIPSVPWLVASPVAGVAVGPDLSCASSSPCERSATVTVTVDPTRLPPGTSRGALTILVPGTNRSYVVTVTSVAVIRVGVPGVTRN